ncbi:polymorphic toxin type 15 domain-containing protein [uncultured Aquimarina sp.]|uniref:polymorphic toxin type 15 domain-containing protein n=1 Tax=uncultured Aquimarina sp. TaxID=575652 RepID=UPI002615338C|nr:polymorphic toxin type 15 domain-containing protein [uncultured Aquimarina sp.]
MGVKNTVPKNISLKCPYGKIKGSLIVNNLKTTIKGLDLGTEADMDVTSFGTCSRPGMIPCPCVPEPKAWVNLSDPSIICSGKRLLTHESELFCAKGPIFISIDLDPPDESYDKPNVADNLKSKWNNFTSKLTAPIENAGKAVSDKMSGALETVTKKGGELLDSARAATTDLIEDTAELADIVSDAYVENVHIPLGDHMGKMGEGGKAMAQDFVNFADSNDWGNGAQAIVDIGANARTVGYYFAESAADTVIGVKDLAVGAVKTTVHYGLNPGDIITDAKSGAQFVMHNGKKVMVETYRRSAMNAVINNEDFMAAMNHDAELLGLAKDGVVNWFKNATAEDYQKLAGKGAFTLLTMFGGAGGAKIAQTKQKYDAAKGTMASVDQTADIGSNALNAAKNIGQKNGKGDTVLKGSGKTPEQIKAEKQDIQDKYKKEQKEKATAVKRIKEIKSKPFIRNPEHDKAEFDKQLKGQEEGINELTVDDFIKNRDEYLKNKRSKEGSKAQKEYREQFREDMVEDLMENQGRSYNEAEKLADDFMSNKAALHDPDQVAGGFADNITGLGDSGVNSSLGSQWRTRIGDVDKQVREAAKNMTQAEKESTLLNINLTGE